MVTITAELDDDANQKLKTYMVANGITAKAKAVNSIIKRSIRIVTDEEIFAEDQIKLTDDENSENKQEMKPTSQ